MRGQWGDLHSIYETRGESLYEQQPLPRLIRDPESSFSGYWDFSSVAFLLYVCFATPVRACFGVSILLWRCGRAAPAPAAACCHERALPRMRRGRLAHCVARAVRRFGLTCASTFSSAWMSS